MGARGMSQETRILNYLKTARAITPLQALDKFGCFRLAARIHDLRAKGYEIETEEVRGKPYARYRLVA